MAGTVPTLEVLNATARIGRARVPTIDDAGRVFAVAARMCRPMICKFLLVNLAASGIKNKSGALAAAVRFTVVWSSRGMLRWAFPRSTDDKVHKYGNALNYGAVRQPRPVRVVSDLPSNNEKQTTRAEGILGARAKKTLKRQVLGYTGQSHRADVWRQGKTNRARAHRVWLDSRQVSQNRKTRSTSVPVAYQVADDTKEKTGRVTVTRPRDFYDLTADQAAAVQTAFAGYVARYLDRQARRG